jgi:catechol 2,3-dioxygenase-like lactoylglutathione lyase family enzyme
MREPRLLNWLIVFGVIFLAGASVAAETTPKALVEPYLMTKIVVKDIDRSEAFYTKVMGMTAVAVVDNAKLKEVALTMTGKPFDASIMLWSSKDPNKKPAVVGDGFRTFIFVTKDIHGMIKRIKDAGMEETRPLVELAPSPLQTLSSPEKISKLLVWHGKDPDGYGLEVIEMSLGK